MQKYISSESHKIFYYKTFPCFMSMILLQLT